MKTFAIICAMEKEVRHIHETLGAKLVDEKRGIYELVFGEKRLVATVSGIGKVNSALKTQYIIDRYSPDFVINIGIAGGLDKSLRVLDTVIGERVMYHDFHPLSILEEDENIGVSVFESDRFLVKAAESVCADKGLNFKSGLIVSGDCFVESDELSAHLRDGLGASCVEMEGASIAQTCIINRVPFLVLRAISDFADDNAEMTYDDFCHIACRNAVELIWEIINRV